MNTEVQKAIEKFGINNIFMIGYDYHGKYEDDYCTFVYYNNITGEYFHDEWTTAFACPAYGNYECMRIDEAYTKNLINLELLLSVEKKRLIERYNKFNVDPYSEFEKIARFGLRVEVKRGRKWKGIGFLINSVVTEYQWAQQLWRSDNGYGTTHTRHAKIYDPITNHIETVTASNVDFLDLNNIIESYKKEMIEAIENSTINNLKIGNCSSSYSPYSGDNVKCPVKLDVTDKMFKDYLESKSNKINVEYAIDVIEDEKRKKAEEFKAKKMPDIIEWVKNNTDKEGDDIQKLAEHIFNKKYN